MILPDNSFASPDPILKAAFAVRRGNAHLLGGLPCQDSAAGTSATPCAAVALCDGAGSQPDSGLAAERLAHWAIEWLPAAFDRLYPLSEKEIAAQILEAGTAQLDALGMSRQSCYCTFLCFVRHADGRWLAAHIGDGFIFGAGHVISMPENGAFADETFFFTGENAPTHLRIQKGRDACETAVLLTSDGCAQALYDWQTAAPAPAVDKLLNGFSLCSEEQGRQALERNLEEVFSRYSEDDLSLALLWAQVPNIAALAETSRTDILLSIEEAHGKEEGNIEATGR